MNTIRHRLAAPYCMKCTHIQKNSARVDKYRKFHNGTVFCTVDSKLEPSGLMKMIAPFIQLGKLDKNGEYIDNEPYQRFIIPKHCPYSMEFMLLSDGDKENEK